MTIAFSESGLKNLTKDIRRATRMSQVKAIIKFCIHQQNFVTYYQMARPLGMFSGGTELASILGDLMAEDHQAGDPLISSAVVRSRLKPGIAGPGRGYFTMARDLGYLVGTSPKDEFKFWAAQTARLQIIPVDALNLGSAREAEVEEAGPHEKALEKAHARNI